METSLVGWMLRKLDDQSCVYRIQLSGANKRLVNKLTRQIGGKIVGEGYGSKDKQTVLIFEKTFQTPKDWIKFAKELEINVTEYNPRTDKYKEISKRKPGRPRKSKFMTSILTKRTIWLKNVAP